MHAVPFTCLLLLRPAFPTSDLSCTQLESAQAQAAADAAATRAQMESAADAKSSLVRELRSAQVGGVDEAIRHLVMGALYNKRKDEYDDGYPDERGDGGE